MSKVDKWLESGKYLPEFMRDFHDQKDLFKAIQEVADNSKENGNHYLTATWVENQVYTVDIFLWVMAKRGYTLQRSRAKLEFSCIGDFVSSFKARTLEKFGFKK